MNGMEKLREYADATKWGGECRILHAHHGDFAGDCSERECNECRAAYLRAVADEMQANMRDAEARLLPEGMEWPTVDGKPEYCHRPTPNVLDADGVVIHVGDTLYDTETGRTRIVRSVNVNGTIEFEGLAELGWLADYFTHELPVFDADGNLIKVGKVYYGKSDGAAWLVEGIDTSKTHPVLAINASKGAKGLKPEWLSIEPPDTWERIEDDATLPPREYYVRHVGHDAGLKDDEEVNGAFGKSLVRRCKALAEREAR